MAQGTRTFAATATTLGAIPDGKLIAIDVTAPGIVQSVALSLTMTAPNIGDYAVSLIGPDGTEHSVFSWAVAVFRPVSGTYVFTDTAATTFFSAGYAGSGTVPPGSYKSSNGSGGVQSLDATFTGLASPGTWTLRVRDFNGTNATGSVSAASLTIGMIGGMSATATPSSLGAIPDGLSGGPYAPGPPRLVTFSMPPAGRVTHVDVRLTVTHTWVGDLVATLVSPSGRQHVLFGYTGAATVGSNGFSNDLNGTYRFSDSAASMSWWTAAAFAVVPSGHYQTSQSGPGANGGQATLIDATFAGDDSAGVWTLRITDGTRGDVGTVTAASLTLTSLPVPATVNDAFTGQYATTLSVPAPGVLGNDDDRVAGPMGAVLLAPAANGSVSLSATGAFSYTPRVGFTGSDSFTYRATNGNGAGGPATVTIGVAIPTTITAPSDFRTAALHGNQVTLRWTPAPGPPPTGFVIEGGVAPGQVLASAVVGGPVPVLEFQAPPGIYYLRVHALENGQRSGPSNEIPLVVATPAPPSAPDAVTGLVNGTTLRLSWRNTFAGGEPTSSMVSVTGAGTGALHLPLTESFAFTGIPGGSYTFRVRSVNAAGTSADSAPVSLTFPSACSGAPATPEHLSPTP